MPADLASSHGLSDVGSTTRFAAVAFAALGMLGYAQAATALAEGGPTDPGARHSVHYALGCREPSDVVKVANHIRTNGCRPINLRWVKIDAYDIRFANTEMILVQHPFYGQVYILRPQE